MFFLKVENSFDGRLVRKPQEEFTVAAGKSEGVSFAELAAAKAAEKVLGQSRAA